MLFGRTTRIPALAAARFFSFQPSELTKIALILAMTRFFTENENPRPYGFRELALPFLFLALPLLFVFKQPDLEPRCCCFDLHIHLAFIGLRLRTWVILGSDARGRTPILALPQGLSKNPLIDFSQSGPRPAENRIPYTQSKIAVGSEPCWVKAFSKALRVNSTSAGATYRLRLFRLCRRMGFHRLLYSPLPLLLLISGAEDRQYLQG